MRMFLMPLVAAAILFSPSTGLANCEEARIMAARAHAYFEMQPQNSLELLEKAHQLCPGDYAIYYNLGLALYLTNKPGESYKVWAELAKRHADSKLLVNLGWLALELGRPEEAEEWRKKSEEHNASDPNAVALHVEILFALNRPKEALDIAALNKGRVPFNISRDHLEKVTAGIRQTYENGDKSEAADQLRDAIREYPEIKKLQSARDLMRILFFDRKVEMSGEEK